LLEIDKLKTILRGRIFFMPTAPKIRPNTAGIRLRDDPVSEYANEPIDVAHVVKMVLIHDIVEIDAGDTYLYDVVLTRSRVNVPQRIACSDCSPDQGKGRALWTS
jgi:putative hydrolase of HD superfamily